MNSIEKWLVHKKTNKKWFYYGMQHCFTFHYRVPSPSTALVSILSELTFGISSFCLWPEIQHYWCQRIESKNFWGSWESGKQSEEIILF